MTSTQISIRRDVYEKLRRAKQVDESFSDVIDRLIDEKSNVQDFLSCYGIASGPDEDIFLEAYKEARKIVRDNFKSRVKQALDNE
jgi:predicted CopG family antitoxin